MAKDTTNDKEESTLEKMLKKSEKNKAALDALKKLEDENKETEIKPNIKELLEEKKANPTEENKNEEKPTDKPEPIPEGKPIGEDKKSGDVPPEEETKTQVATVVEVVEDNQLTVDIMKKNNYAGLKLKEIRECYAREIENLLYSRGKVNTLALDDDIVVKKDWDDEHPAKSYPASQVIHDAINVIWKRSGLKKYQVFERLILGGLKNDDLWK